MSFDVKTAFLHARLPYSIYIKQIPGYPEDDPKTVLRLLVALYGL
jgi:Reverse transcriptase (RNA-dependent DNA polymerase)